MPTVGESITEATLANWNKKNGEYVERDEIILTLETDKASMEIVAEYAGTLSIIIDEGSVVAIGTKLGEIDTSTKPAQQKTNSKQTTHSISHQNPALSPAVRKMAIEKNIDVQNLHGSGKMGRITKGDILNNSSTHPSSTAAHSNKKPESIPDFPTVNLGQQQEEITRKTMSPLRKTLARRLVEAQQTAAILTTFNEIDMSQVVQLRKTYKEDFKKKHGVSLGFMGLFVKATLAALKKFPQVASQIDGDDLVFTNFINIGIAVSTKKGLIVPVIKHADKMSLPEIELAILHYATKGRDGKISMDDLTGGSFTISNGGVFGSLMSTPILNPPQSGILGLHKIEERPIAVNGQVIIKPMMYVALSYDHRVIDGKESVGFLLSIKESIENPARLLLHI